MSEDFTTWETKTTPADASMLRLGDNWVRVGRIESVSRKRYGWNTRNAIVWDLTVTLIGGAQFEHRTADVDGIITMILGGKK